MQDHRKCIYTGKQLMSIQKSLRKDESGYSHSRPQNPRSFCSAPRIETSGRLEHRKSAIHEFIVKFDKSNWLKIQNEYFAHALAFANPVVSHDQSQPTKSLNSHIERSLIIKWSYFSTYANVRLSLSGF